MHRLIYENEAGKEKKHKGYGFCEYPEYETFLSGIRNLNDLEFQSKFFIKKKILFFFKVDVWGCFLKRKLNEQWWKSKAESSDFDPISFELKNENKTLTEILVSLDKTQTYFIMKEMKAYFLHFVIFISFLFLI